MSSRVLRKIQGENDLNDEVSDNEIENEVPSGGARRKQLNVNRYDLLNQLSYSESEVKEDDNETEANKSCEGHDFHESTKRKRKKKKKKSGKSVTAERSSEDNADMDEVERSVREVNKILGDAVISRQSNIGMVRIDKLPSSKRNILNVQHKHLNPNNELKRIFGSKIIQTEHKKKHRSARGHVKATWLVSVKDNWPQVTKTGLSMSVSESKSAGGMQLFNFEHSVNYRAIQTRFFEAVESINTNFLVEIINEHPYHIDALIQVSDLCKISENLAMAAEIIERALYFLECAFHPSFNIATGNCRMDYRRQENRALFITLFKHLLNVGSRACYRTALEFCKLILSLDPEGDPLAIKLALDFYALRSREYQWFVDLCTEWEPTMNLSQLPNFAFSLPIAHYYLTNGESKLADQLLQDALMMFPSALMPLLEKCSVQIDSRVAKHEYFGAHIQNKQSPALTQLINLYVHRSYHVWKEADLLHWMEKNVHAVLNRVDAGEPLAKEYEKKRAIRYQGNLPRNINRHILLSDMKGVSISPQAEDTGIGIMSFDPFPPHDSINIYSRNNQPRTTESGSTTLGMFFRSLLPNYNNEIPENNPLEHEGAHALAEGAAGNEGAEGGDLRMSVASLVGAIRDLLSNIRLAEVPAEADVDENDDSDDDDDPNNYLT